VASEILRNLRSWAPLGSSLSLTVRTLFNLGEEDCVPGLVMNTWIITAPAHSWKPKTPNGALT